VPQDDLEAVRWYTLAAEQGDSYAQNGLGQLYRNGYGVEQDYVQGYKWLQLAAAQGHEDAAKALAAIAGRMTTDQIAEAKQLAADWKPR
jgi:uncharacterized protein